MPLLMMLGGALLRWLGPMLLQLLLMVGFSTITYVGMEGVIDALKSQWSTSLAGLPTVVGQLLGLAKVDVALSFILSGYAFKLAKGGLTGGSKKLIKLRPR